MLVSTIVVLRIGSCLLFGLSTIVMAESSMVSPKFSSGRARLMLIDLPQGIGRYSAGEIRR